MDTIKDFVTSFLFLTLNAVNDLLWRKIVSHYLHIIIVSIPRKLLKVFLMEESGFPTKGETGGFWLLKGPIIPKLLSLPILLEVTLNQWPESSPFLSCFSLCFFFYCRPHIGKKVSLVAFRQIFQNAWRVHFQIHSHELLEKVHWS